MNPARSIGPAIASGTWTDLWLCIVGPVAGAALGVLAYTVVGGEGRVLRASGPADG